MTTPLAALQARIQLDGLTHAASCLARAKEWLVETGHEALAVEVAKLLSVVTAEKKSHG